jgi:hypothetical protein
VSTSLNWVNMYHSPSAGKESAKVSSSLNRVFEGHGHFGLKVDGNEKRGGREGDS